MLWSLVLHTLIDLKYQPSRARLSFLCNNLAFAWTALETRKTNGRQRSVQRICTSLARADPLCASKTCHTPPASATVSSRCGDSLVLAKRCDVKDELRSRCNHYPDPANLHRYAYKSNPIRCMYKLVVPNVHEKCTFSSVCILRNPG